MNSLYPSQMRNQLMQVGVPTYFKGDIRLIDSKAFGFFYCKIIAPDDILHPIIQTHVKTDNGIRTISPIGNWEDIIFSPEMDNAKKFGYKFEILWGYKFKLKNIFKSYVGVLYNLRLQYPKLHPLNLIAKLLLNSLYGRFGMIDKFPNITIFKDFKFFNKWFKIYNEDVIDFLELGEKILIQHRSDLQDQQTSLYGNLETHNISIVIAAAITAYARIHMSQFKNNPNFTLYYSDTDSIYINTPLSNEFVDEKILGKMKLEYILEDAIFLAPKVYHLETQDKEVIYKVKGLKHEIELSRSDFESLLYKDVHLKKFQDKWIRNLSKGYIEIINELYSLQVTDNKRKLIYDQNKKLINSMPYIINSDKEIINKKSPYTTNNITFLKDIHSTFKVDMRSGWRHHYFDGLSIYEIATFIKLIGDDKIYLIIPFLATSKNPSNARLRLSDPFLVNNKSNPALIVKLIMEQWESSGFYTNVPSLVTSSFEFKRVWITESYK